MLIVTLETLERVVQFQVERNFPTVDGQPSFSEVRRLMSTWTILMDTDAGIRDLHPQFVKTGESEHAYLGESIWRGALQTQCICCFYWSTIPEGQLPNGTMALFLFDGSIAEPNDV